MCCGRSNDAYDAETGVDQAKEESVVNLTGGNKKGVLALANACLLAGAWLLHTGTKAAVCKYISPVGFLSSGVCRVKEFAVYDVFPHRSLRAQLESMRDAALRK